MKKDTVIEDSKKSIIAQLNDLEKNDRYKQGKKEGLELALRIIEYNQD